MMKKLFIMLMSLILCVALATPVFAADAPFRYRKGDTFVLNGTRFEIVDSHLLMAVTYFRIPRMDWNTATMYSASYAASYPTVVFASGLPGAYQYLDSSWRSQLVNLAHGEWTSTTATLGSGRPGAYVGGPPGLYKDGVTIESVADFRSVLYLKPGLYQSETTRELYAPLPYTFGDLTIQ